jgi:hypothetical protein
MAVARASGSCIWLHAKQWFRALVAATATQDGSPG